MAAHLKFTPALSSILAVAAGMLAPLSLSPLDIWPAGIVSVACLLALVQDKPSGQSAWLGWCYGLGFFGLGASWVYVSINVYGNAGPLLAGFLTLLFVAGLALLSGLQCWLYRRFFSPYLYPLTFAALWVLGEWCRSWLLTGFPWLYLGYGHTQTWLAGLAPVLGVFGISFVVSLSAGMLYYIARHCQETGRFNTPLRQRLTFGLCLLWTVPALMQFIPWVSEDTPDEISVGLVQANIDQNIKFDNRFLQDNLGTYNRLTIPLLNSDIIIWPETAIPLLYQDAGAVLDYFAALAGRNDAALVTGILYREEATTYNSITSIGSGQGIYHKQKLVPFGEYVPLRSVLEGVLQLFDLPMSSLRPGPADQMTLTAAGLNLAPFICYEIVYPDFVRRSAAQSDLLVTISNDTWFGASWGPLQHLQMAAMRALENGRYLVRGTNNGVSAIIDYRGNILSRTQQFEAETLQGNIRVMSGTTPYSRYGSTPVLLLSGFILILNLITRHRLGS